MRNLAAKVPDAGAGVLQHMGIVATLRRADDRDRLLGLRTAKNEGGQNTFSAPDPEVGANVYGHLTTRHPRRPGGDLREHC